MQISRFAATLFGLLFASAAVSAQDPVATLTHEAPSSATYILHGTIPIPSGTWNGDREHPTLAVQNPDGSFAPTQMEVVTRSADGIPEVVELIAEVTRLPQTNPGDSVEFLVYPRQRSNGPHQLHPEVAQLMAGPGELILRTTDVFSNRYEADLLRDWHIGQDAIRKQGVWVEQKYGHEVLLPTAASNTATAMPHMMGSHVYVTTYADRPFVALDLLVHNGLHGLDEESAIDDLLDRLYFRNLVLELPVGWQVISMFENPTEGTLQENQSAGYSTIDLIKSQAGGKMHAMPQQSRFTRRLMLVKDDPAAIAEATEVMEREHLAFVKRPERQADLTHWSWWNPATAFYYPQKFVLPTLNDFDLPEVQNNLERFSDRIQGQVEDGEGGLYPFVSDPIGWSHPWGNPYGGQPGGDEIHFVDGLRTVVTASRKGYQLAEFAAKSYMDRSPMAFYGADGMALRLRDLMEVDSKGRIYASCHFQMIPIGNHAFPRFDLTDKSHEEAVLWLGLEPDYLDHLEAWQVIDTQHLVRHTRNYKTMVWVGNDSLAKDEMRLVAELYRLSLHEVYQSPYGYIQGSGLLAKQLYVNKFPGVGISIGRGEAWGIDAACAAYAIEGPEFRNRFLPWFEIITEVVRDGQSTCTGNVMSFPISNYFQGRYTVRQSFEVAMVEQALRSMAQSVFKDVDEPMFLTLQDVASGSTYSSMREPFWDPLQRGPWFTIATGTHDPGLFPDLCENIPREARLDHVDFTDYWNAIAYTYQQTQDPFLWTRMEIMLDAAEETLGRNQLTYDLRIEARASVIALFETPLPQ